MPFKRRALFQSQYLGSWRLPARAIPPSSSVALGENESGRTCQSRPGHPAGQRQTWWDDVQPVLPLSRAHLSRMVRYPKECSTGSCCLAVACGGKKKRRNTRSERNSPNQRVARISDATSSDTRLLCSLERFRHEGLSVPPQLNQPLRARAQLAPFVGIVTFAVSFLFSATDFLAMLAAGAGLSATPLERDMSLRLRFPPVPNLFRCDVLLKVREWTLVSGLMLFFGNFFLQHFVVDSPTGCEDVSRPRWAQTFGAALWLPL